ncbi:SDR family oxidoreductase [Mycolicibacterium sp. YH-1]|uniref:SDR family oxidoreductase n=1 Tax=Mycolicibacterium sp. YH-1 TaxID=2908837 RepID=UPI001F4C06A8|nr:NAD(P)H-binding protein [Mycolicibacterium sp. YH-1]UNB55244.1 NAD(P)H-binding protein [Mycolicibacterium sp. YH-1]
MTILVTGATGNIGRRVVDHLITLGAKDIRALTANPTKAQLPDSVTAITGYLGRPDSLRAALDGVERVYLAPYTETLTATLALMKEAGVQYVVALSGGAHWSEHADAVTASGLPHTQLGPGEFCENFAMWADQIRTTQTVAEPYPDAVEAPVSMDDIARVAAHLLTGPQDPHLSRMYDLTGPKALSRGQIAEQIGVGIGVPVTVQHCNRTEAEELLRPVMGDGVQWYFDLFSAGSEPQVANDAVEQLTGTPAMSMAQWAAANADQFR